jgi:hypothetical protein
MDDESMAFFTKKLCGPGDEDDDMVQMYKLLCLAYFYLLPKAHKTPWKMHPVLVRGVSTMNEASSKWIHIQL